MRYLLLKLELYRWCYILLYSSAVHFFVHFIKQKVDELGCIVLLVAEKHRKL
jgi:hypothetical protein